METEPTIGDVLEAVNKGFSGVQVDIEILKADVTAIKTHISGLQSDVVGIKQEITGIKAVMVTKDYLDEKLGRTDGKINSLVNVLERKAVITADDKRTIMA